MARRLQGNDHAVLTAAIWTVAGALFSPVPWCGPVIALLGLFPILKWRYAVGWLRAAA